MSPKDLKTLYKIFDDYRTDKKDKVFQVTIENEDAVYVSNVSARNRPAAAKGGQTRVSRMTPEQKNEMAARARNGRIKA